MTRASAARVALAGVLCGSALLAACEDAIVFVGDMPGVMRRVAGRPNSAGASVDPLAVQTRLSEPWGLAVADDGTLYIADSGNGRIVEVTPAGRARVHGDSDCGDGCLVTPRGLALSPDGAVWIADPGAGRVFRLDPATGDLEVRAGTGDSIPAPDGTPALEASLQAPTGVAVGPTGLVYFSERAGHRIRYLAADGTLATLAGTGVAGYQGEGGAARAALLDSPAGMTVRASTLYFADERNHRVRAIDLQTDAIRLVAGSGAIAYDESQTVAVRAGMSSPRAVAATPEGRQLFIAASQSHRVLRIDLASGRILGFAGTGDGILTPEGRDAGETSLFAPAGLAVQRDGFLFIADTYHQIVWRTPIRF